MIPSRTFTNKPGATFDALKTTVIFAEDLNDIIANISNVSVLSLKITYTGEFQTALVLPIVKNSIAIVPRGSVAGQATYTAPAGPTIAKFLYNESATIFFANTLLTFSFDDLVGVSGDFNPTNCASLTSLSMNALVSVGGVFSPQTMMALTTLSATSLKYVGSNFVFANMGALTSLSMNALVSVGGAFTPSGMASLTTLSFTSLLSVGGSFSPSSMASLTTFSFPALVLVSGSMSLSNFAALTNLTMNALVSCVGGVNLSNFAALTTFSFASLKTSGACSISNAASLTTVSINSLEQMTGGFVLATMASLTTVSLSRLINMGANISFQTSNGNISSVNIGTIGTLKNLGFIINISGQKLPSANVNYILALLVSLNGTGGTTLWGTGRTLTINGGTNGAPTGQGIIDKATLVARGATITTN